MLVTVGKGHPDFSGKEQQDANEFYTHLTTLMDRCHHMPADFDPADRLMFEVERRVECGSSGKVKYLPRVEDYLPLPIDLDDAVNKETVAAYEKLKKEKEEKGERVEEKDKVRAKIPIEACLKKFCFVEEVRISSSCYVWLCLNKILLSRSQTFTLRPSRTRRSPSRPCGSRPSPTTFGCS